MSTPERTLASVLVRGAVAVAAAGMFVKSLLNLKSAATTCYLDAVSPCTFVSGTGFSLCGSYCCCRVSEKARSLKLSYDPRQFGTIHFSFLPWGLPVENWVIFFF